MAQDTKFGTFGGVFTPSILTILGVIMYLRLPWVVGNAGLYAGLGVIAVAHVVSVCTGLSISSIATDKKVGAGGPYYIISRSLGLPIGGTLGLALFTGLAFSISLYVIGFSESFLSYWGWEVNQTTIRICGSAVLLALTIVTLISTALAIKTQYLILTLIVLSLVSIFAGSSPAGGPEAPVLSPAPDGASMAVIFGIFFPAVTGFTAGVNMSGDLRDPKKSIPSGTIAAILVGLIVYLVLAWFLTTRVSREQLVNNPDVLLDLAYYAPAVVAGIWGATLSSALGSILGAPRILQAVAGDRIVWRWFAKGHGPSREPRNALLLAFAIGEAGVLIAELDAIARIVSMVFLATYGFLNLSCAIESWVSPDFRPDFRIPRSVSVVGAGVCALLMIQLDLLAMLGSTAILVGLFFFLSRKQLTLDAGDAWEGVWSSLVRSGLWRLSRERGQQRNWRPNILAFRPADDDVAARLRSVAGLFITGNGIVTDVELDEGKGSTEEPEDETELGIFHERLETVDPYRTVTDVCRYHGFTGIAPNTVLLDWQSLRRDEGRFGELLDVVTQLDHNLLVSAPGSAEGDTSKRIDIWWSSEAGNATLATALVRFITRHRRYGEAEVRFLLLSNESASNDHLRSIMRGLLTDARVQASIRIVNNTLRTAGFFDHVGRESSDAALAVVGLPIDPDRSGPAYQREVDEVLASLSGELLLMRASSSFEEVLRLSRQGTISFLPPSTDEGHSAELPELALPEPPELSATVAKLADSYQRMVSRLHKSGLQRVYGREVKLLRRLRKAVDKHFGALEKGLGGANPRRVRNLLNRTQSSLLKDFAEQLEAFADKGIEAQRGSLEGRIRAFLEGRGVLEGDKATLTVQRPREDFEPNEYDEPEVARLKRRKLLWTRSSARRLRYTVPIGRLEAYYFERAVDEVLLPALHQFVTDSHNLLVHLGKTLSSPHMDLVLANDELPSEEQMRQLVREQKQSLLEGIDALVQHSKSRIGQHQWSLLAGSRELMQQLSDDLGRLDVTRLVRRERRVDQSAAAVRREELKTLPSTWFHNQKLVVERALLGLQLSTFQHRLASTVEREKQAIFLGIRHGALGECEQFLEGLRSLHAQLEAQRDDGDDDSPLVIAFDTRADLEQRFDVERVLSSLVTGTADLASELPTDITTLSDESIQRLEEGRSDEIETVEVPVMRLSQFLVEARFVGTVQTALERIPRLEARASGVAQDAVRLVSFQLSELGGGDEDSSASVAEQLGPVVESGIERLEAEIAGLGKALEEVAQTIDEQLGVVIDGTNAYDLTGTAANLDQHIRRHHGERAAAGARSLLRRTRARLKAAGVQLIYRKSAGLLMARELRHQSAAKGNVVDRVRALVEEHMPRPEVFEQLPSYYRQLFYGQATISETFWVGRQRQLAAAKRAITTFGRGASGAIVVTGERGSGKTSLVQRIATELLARRPIYRLTPPREGATVSGAFGEALRKAVLGEGTAEEVLAVLPDDPVIVLDDLELWWERSDQGMVVIDEIVDLVQKHGERILFILSLSSQAFAFINRFRPVSDDALAVLECGPVHAEDLKSIVMLRHGSTGLDFELGGKSHEQLSELKLARLFSSHFDYSGGHVGTALRSWITHVRKINGSALVVEPPSPERWEVLDELRPSHKALLTQLVLHKVLTRTALRRVTALEDTSLSHDVDTLVRMGLIQEGRHQTLSINPFVHHGVVRRLQQRGLLS